MLQEGSTRACAVLRMLVMGVIVFWSLVRDHPVGLDDPLQRTLGVVLLVAAPMAFVGYKTRWSTMIVALVWGYLHVRWSLLEHSSYRHGVQEVQSVLYVALLPCGKSFSIDRWLEVRRAKRVGEALPLEQGPLWATWIVVLSMSCLYFWAGMDKVDADWFAGRRMDRLLMHNWGSSDSLARYPDLVRWGSIAAAWGATTLELSLALGLLIPRLRRYMVFPGLALHLGIWLMLGVFPYTHLCIAAYVMLLPPERVHSFFDTVFERGASRSHEEAEPRAGSRVVVRGAQLVAVLALAAWGLYRPHRAASLSGARGVEILGLHGVLQGRSRAICDLRYFDGPEGSEPLERWKLLGHDSIRDMPAGDRGVRRRQIARHTARICAGLEATRGEPVDVRASIRCPSDEGWQQLEDRERNVCAKRTPSGSRKGRH